MSPGRHLNHTPTGRFFDELLAVLRPFRVVHRFPLHAMLGFPVIRRPDF